MTCDSKYEKMKVTKNIMYLFFYKYGIIKRWKNMMVFLCMLRLKIQNDLILFCNTTTVHGLRHIVSPHTHPFEKIFWLMTFLCMVMATGFMIASQLERYTTRPTVVSVKMDYRTWATPFPAVTACSNARVDPGLAKNFIMKTWKVTPNDSEKFEYYSRFVELAASVSFRTNLRLFWKFEHDSSFVGVDLMDVATAVTSPLVLRAVLFNPKQKIEWVTVMTEMGICRTFNSVFSRYQSIETWELQHRDGTPDAYSKELSEDDLLSCHFMDRGCYGRFSLVNFTGVYYIHSPWELAETTSVNTGPVEEGMEVEGGLRALIVRSGPEVRRLHSIQRGCRYPTESISDKIPAYSNALCQIDCRSRMAIIFCGCRPFFYIVGNGKVCDTAGMACLGRSMEILVNLPPNLAKCQCVPQCTEINYVLHEQNIKLWNKSDGSIFDRHPSVRLALQVPRVLMHKDRIFSFEDLLASFGGVSALFLGISIVSIVEILLFLTRPFQDLFRCLLWLTTRRQSTGVI